MNRIFQFIVLAGFLCASGVDAQENWPQFRGPNAGVVEDGVLPTTWSTTENVAWVIDIPYKSADFI